MRRTPFLLLLAACSRSPSEPTAEPTAPSTAPASSTAPVLPPLPAPVPAPAPALALHWDDPPRWQRRPPSTSMRAAEYVIPHAKSDAENGECLVITFGPGQGGTVDENVDRWVRQLGAPASTPVRTTRTVGGMAVTRVELTGTYTPMSMPGGPPAASPHPGWRLSGAIVQAPSGLWFFKMTGPDATIKAADPELDALVDSVHPR